MTLCSSWGQSLQEAHAELLEVFENMKNYMTTFENCGVYLFIFVSLYLVWIRFPGEMPFPQGQRHEAAEALAPLWNPGGPSPHSCAAPCERSHPLSCWSLLFKTQQKTFTFQVCLEGETC